MQKPPLQTAVEPPATRIFSRTTTLRPSSAARAAAELPAAPVPITTTSASASKAAASFASATSGMKPAIAETAAVRLKRVRRVRSFACMGFSFLEMMDSKIRKWSSSF